MTATSPKPLSVINEGSRQTVDTDDELSEPEQIFSKPALSRSSSMSRQSSLPPQSPIATRSGLSTQTQALKIVSKSLASEASEKAQERRSPSPLGNLSPSPTRQTLAQLQSSVPTQSPTTRSSSPSNRHHRKESENDDDDDFDLDDLTDLSNDYRVANSTDTSRKATTRVDARIEMAFEKLMLLIDTITDKHEDGEDIAAPLKTMASKTESIKSEVMREVRTFRHELSLLSSFLVDAVESDGSGRTPTPPVALENVDGVAQIQSLFTSLKGKHKVLLDEKLRLVREHEKSMAHLREEYEQKLDRRSEVNDRIVAKARQDFDEKLQKRDTEIEEFRKVYQEKFATKEKEITQLRSENEKKLTDIRNEYETKVKEAMDLAQQLREDYEKNLEEDDSMMAQLETERDQLKKQVAELEKELDEEEESAAQKFADVEKKWNAEVEKNVQLRNKMEELKAEHEKDKEEFMRDVDHAAQVKIQAMHQKITGLEEIITRSAKHADELRQKLRESQDNVEIEKVHVVKVERQLDEAKILLEKTKSDFEAEKAKRRRAGRVLHKVLRQSNTSAEVESPKFGNANGAESDEEDADTLLEGDPYHTYTKKLETELHNLQKKYQEEVNRHLEDRKESEQEKNQNRNISEQLQDVSEKLKKEKEANSKNKESVSKLTMDLEKLRFHVTKLEEKSKALEKELRDEREALRIESEAKQRLTVEMVRLQSDLDNIREEFQEETMASETKSRQLDQLKAQLFEMAKKTHSDVDNGRGMSQDVIKYYENEIRMLQHQLRDEKQIRVERDQEHRKVVDSLNDVEIRLAEIKQMYEAEISSSRQLRSLKEKLLVELSATQSELSRTQDRLHEQELLNIQSSTKLQDLESKLVDQTEQAKKLNSQVASLTTEISTVNETNKRIHTNEQELVFKLSLAEQKAKEYEKVVAKLENQEREMNLLEGRVHSLQSSIEDGKSAQTKLQSEQRDHLLAKQQLENTLMEVRKNLETVQLRNVTLEKSAVELEERKRSLEATVENLTKFMDEENIKKHKRIKTGENLLAKLSPLLETQGSLFSPCAASVRDLRELQVKVQTKGAVDEAATGDLVSICSQVHSVVTDELKMLLDGLKAFKEEFARDHSRWAEAAVSLDIDESIDATLKQVLQKLISSLRQRMDETATALGEFNESIESALHKCDKKITVLSFSLKENQGQRKETYEQVAHRLEELSKSLGQLKADNNKLQNELRSSIISNQELEESNAKFAEKIKALEKSVSEKERQLSDFQSTVKTQEEQLQDISTTREAVLGKAFELEKTIHGYEEIMSTKESALSDVQSKYARNVEYVVSLEKDLKLKTFELQQSRIDADTVRKTLEKEVETHRAQIQTLQEAVEWSNQKSLELQTQLKSLQSDLTNLQLQAQKDKTEQEFAVLNLKQHIKTLEKVKITLTEELERKSRQLEEVFLELDSHQRSQKSGESDSKLLREQLLKKDQRTKKLTQELEGINRQFNDLEKEKSKLESELAQKEISLRQANLENEILRASKEKVDNDWKTWVDTLQSSSAQVTSKADGILDRMASRIIAEETNLHNTITQVRQYMATMSASTTDAISSTKLGSKSTSSVWDKEETKRKLQHLADQLESAIKLVREGRKVSIDERAGLAAQIKQESDARKDAEEKSKKLKEEVSELQHDLSRTRKERDQLKTKLAQLESQKQEAESKLRNITEGMAEEKLSYVKERQEFETARVKLLQERDELQELIASLRNRLSEVELEHSRLVNDLEAGRRAEEAKTELEGDLQLVVQELHHTKSTYLSMQAKLRDAEAQNGQLKKELERTLMNAKKMVEQSKNTFEEENSRLQAEVSRQQAKNAAMASNLQQNYDSKLRKIVSTLEMQARERDRVDRHRLQNELDLKQGYERQIEALTAELNSVKKLLELERLGSTSVKALSKDRISDIQNENMKLQVTLDLLRKQNKILESKVTALQVQLKSLQKASIERLSHQDLLSALTTESSKKVPSSSFNVDNLV